jgi:protein-disulfide isomerase
MKNFYIGLGVVVAVGVGAIWAARNSGAGPETIEPLPVTGEAFPGYVIGSDSAPVEIIEFADFQCPACAQFAVLTVPDIKQRLVQTGLVRWVFKDFPLDIHRNAVAAHLAAACADEQGQFWNMHDLLFFRLGEWAEARRPDRRHRNFAEGLGLDMDRYDDCMGSRRHAGRIARSRQDGAQLGVASTPTFIIGNLRVAGAISYDSLKTLVDRAAAAAQ